MIVGSPVTEAMVKECRHVNRLYGTAISKTSEVMDALSEQQDQARKAYETAQQAKSDDAKDLLRAYQAAKRKHRRAEAEADDSRKAIFAFVRLWAYSKPIEERNSWCLALHTLVCRPWKSDEKDGRRAPTGSIEFLAFPEEIQAMTARRTGGKVVPLNLPAPRDGWIRMDERARVFLVQPIRGTLKHNFLFQIGSDHTLLFTPQVDAPEGTETSQPAASTDRGTEEKQEEQAPSAAMTVERFVQRVNATTNSAQAKTA
jgi:hypothetical protein